MDKDSSNNTLRSIRYLLHYDRSVYEAEYFPIGIHDNELPNATTDPSYEDALAYLP